MSSKVISYRITLYSKIMKKKRKKKTTSTKEYVRNLASSIRWSYEAKEISSQINDLMTTSESLSKMMIEEAPISWAKSKAMIEGY